MENSPGAGKTNKYLLRRETKPSEVLQNLSSEQDIHKHRLFLFVPTFWSFLVIVSICNFAANWEVEFYRISQAATRVKAYINY